MPITAFHGLTATTPDNPAFEIRPSHWNDAHSLTLSAVGSEVIGAFSNAGNVSFGVDGGGFITASANVTAAPSPVNVTGANGSSANAQTIAFSNSNGMTLGVSTAANGATITGSYTVPTQTAFVFSNSNGVSFGTNGSTVTATVATNYQSQGAYLTTAAQSNQVVNSLNGSVGQVSLNVGSSLSASTNGSSITFGLASNITTALQSAGAYLTTAAQSNHSHGNPTLALTNLSGTTASNSAGLTLSLSAAAPGGAASQTLYAVGNSTVNSSGTVPLSAVSMRAYGVLSIGTSNGSVLFSTPDAVDFTQFSGGFSTGGNTAGDTGLVTGRLVFAGGANITLSGSTNGGSQTISIVGGAGGGGGVGLSGGTQSVSTGTVVFSNSNNISFGMSGSSRMTASGALNLYALGNTTQNSSTVLGLGAVSLNAIGALTAGYSNGSVQLSAPATSSLSAGANITISTNGSTISIIGASVAASPVSFSAGASSDALQSVVFSNSNGVSFGLNGSTITAQHNGLTTARASNDAIGLATAQSNVTWTVNSAGLSLDARGYAGTATTFNGTNASGSMTLNSAGLRLDISAAAAAAQTGISGIQVSNTTYTSGTVTWQNANGISFGSSGANGISASYTVPSTAGLLSAIGVTGSNGNFTTTGLSFSNGNGISFGTSAGSAITASHNGLTSQSNQAASAANGSFAFQTLSFSNVNGMSFGTSAGSAITGSYTVPTVTQYISATNTTFNGANISGSMTHNTNGLQLSLSVAAPGAAAENNWVGLLGANTAGNTTASGSTIGWSGQGVTLSGTNGSQIVISAPSVSSLSATGAVSISTNGSTISIGAPQEVTLAGYLEAFIDRELLGAQIGNNQLFMQPMNLRHPAKWEEVAWINSYLATSNSSGSATLTLQVGIYSRNASTLSLITSASNSYAVTNSGTVGSYSIYAGLREFAIPMTTTLPAGNYWMGFLSRTTTGGAAGMTWSNYVASNINIAYSGRWSSANNATNQFVMGLGSFNTTTTAIPNSVGFSQINGSAAANLRPIIYKLVSQDLN